MATLNEGYGAIHASYLFSEVAKRRNAFTARTGKPVIRVDMGDAKLPLSPIVARAMELSAHRPQFLKAISNIRGLQIKYA